MKIKETDISGLLVIQPEIYSDSRGHFMDTYESSIYEDFIGENVRFIKDSISYSKKSVLRGLHFQKDFPQGKLVYVPFGRIFDVVVDLRKKSKTFGKYFSIILSDKENKSLFPEEFVSLFPRKNFKYHRASSKPSSSFSMLLLAPNKSSIR